MNEWLKQFALKSIYGAFATVAAALLAAVTAYDFQGNTFEKAIWSTVVIGGLTGLVAVIKRMVFPWNPPSAILGIVFAGVLCSVALAPTAALAVDLPRAASNAWVLSKVNIGVENKWLAATNASFRDAKPVPQFFGRWEVALPVLRLQGHVEGARRIDKDRPWEARAGVSVKVK